MADAAELRDNAFVAFRPGAQLAATAGMPLAGGANRESVGTADYQEALDRFESVYFNILMYAGDDEAVKALYAAYTRRMRGDVGKKFQTVLYRFAGEGDEGIISVENTADGGGALCWWVAGMQAGCSAGQSLTNSRYTGELSVDVDYTQKQLEDCVKTGKFILHGVSGDVRVLSDINTLREFSGGRNEDFAQNQTVRVMDMIATGIASLFCDRYLGAIPNDAAGRMSLWNDVLTLHRDLEEQRAIESFDADSLRVEQGKTKRSVVVSETVNIVNAMTQLYMSVVVA